MVTDKGSMFLPEHPLNSQQSKMDFLKPGSGIEDGPRRTSLPLDKNIVKNTISLQVTFNPNAVNLKFVSR